MPVAIFGMLFAGIFTFLGVVLRGRPAARTCSRGRRCSSRWAGTSSTTASIRPAAAPSVGWLVCGFVFVAMGGVPLLLLSREDRALVAVGPGSQEPRLPPPVPRPWRKPRERRRTPARTEHAAGAPVASLAHRSPRRSLPRPTRSDRRPPEPDVDRTRRGRSPRNARRPTRAGMLDERGVRSRPRRRSSDEEGRMTPQLRIVLLVLQVVAIAVGIWLGRRLERRLLTHRDPSGRHLGMRFGLDIAQQRMPWSEVASRARFADELGFDGVWGFDHFQPMYGEGPGECFEGNTTLAALERHHRARAARPARHRHDLPPPVGVRGRGDHHRPRVGRPARARVRRRVVRRGAPRARHPVPARSKDRVDAFEEAVQIVRGLLTTDGFTFEGRALPGAATPRCIPRPVQQPHPPIWIGASGEKRMMPIAARYADVWHCFGRPSDLGAEVGSGSSAMAEAAGRDPAEIRRAASLSLEDDPDTIARTIDAVGGRRVRLPRVRLARRRTRTGRGVRQPPPLTDRRQHEAAGTKGRHARDTRPRQPSAGARDGAQLPDPAVRADLLLGGRARPQRRRALRRRRVRLALPHAVREQRRRTS